MPPQNKNFYDQLTTEVNKTPDFWTTLKQEVDKTPSFWDELKYNVDNHDSIQAQQRDEQKKAEQQKIDAQKLSVSAADAARSKQTFLGKVKGIFGIGNNQPDVNLQDAAQSNLKQLQNIQNDTIPGFNISGGGGKQNLIKQGLQNELGGFPFTDKILNNLNTNFIIGTSPQGQGGFKASQLKTSDFLINSPLTMMSEEKAGKIANKEIVQRIVKPDITLDLSSANEKIDTLRQIGIPTNIALAHEILHNIFETQFLMPKSDVGLLRTRPFHQNIVDIFTGNNNLWDTNMIKYPELDKIDFHLATTRDENGKLVYKDIFKPGHERDLAHERYAYLGSGIGDTKGGKIGIKNIPEPFKKFYEGILK